MKFVLIALVMLSGVSFQTIRRNAQTADSTKSNPQQGQPLQLEIPKDSWEQIFFRELDKRMKMTKLSSLRLALPTDDLEARFWVEDGPFGIDGIIIRRTRGAWSGTYIHGVSKKPNFKQYNTQLPPPRSGWEIAWKRLVEGGLLTLPDASQNDCILGGKDTTWFVFETNVNRKYRTYAYEQPEMAECDEAKRMVKLVGILSHEFGLHWSSPVP